MKAFRAGTSVAGLGPNQFPYEGLENAHAPTLLSAQRLAAKGGPVGTGGRGVISLRFDDWQDQFGSTVFPLLQARALVASHVLLSRFQTKEYGQETDWDDVREWNANGIEMWCHGTDHTDPHPDGRAGYYREIVTAKEEIEAEGIKVVGWAMPGTTPANPDVTYAGGLTSLSAYNSVPGRLLVATYGLTEAYAVGVERPLPFNVYHGLDHRTLDQMPLATAKQWVDAAILGEFGQEFMLHAGHLDKPGYMSIAEFTELLDYIVTARDAGECLVLTPSALAFADSTHSNRYNFLMNGDLSKEPRSEAAGWFGDWDLGDDWTVEGTPGERYLASNASTTRFARQTRTTRTLEVTGEVFMFEGEYRAASGTSTPRLIFQDTLDSGRLSRIEALPAVGTDWTRVRFPVLIPRDVERLAVGVGRVGGSAIHWRDMSFRPE